MILIFCRIRLRGQEALTGVPGNCQLDQEQNHSSSSIFEALNVNIDLCPDSNRCLLICFRWASLNFEDEALVIIPSPYTGFWKRLHHIEFYLVCFHLPSITQLIFDSHNASVLHVAGHSRLVFLLQNSNFWRFSDYLSGVILYHFYAFP